MGYIGGVGRRSAVLAAGLTVITGVAGAQVSADPTSDIVVQGLSPSLATPLETRHALDQRAITLIATSSADEIARRLPSLYVPVNSRGEAVAFVRNAAERQVAIFYDGAAINVPWDNRLDLSLLPAALIGNARVAVAPLPPLYGVNVFGAVSFSPRETDGLTVRAMSGSGGSRDVQGVAPLVAGATTLTLGGGHATRSGETLSKAADLPFSQTGSSLRTNTDRDLSSAFARLKTSVAEQSLSLTAFHVEGDKGVAPEGDRASGARFWRYPGVAHTLLSANVGVTVADGTALALVGWYQRFDQTINSFSDVRYVQQDAQEVNRDRTVGARALLSQSLGANVRVTGSLNMLETVHRQRDVTYAAGIAPAVLPAFLRYHQRNWALGGDASVALAPRLTGDIGAGYDRVSYLDTGDKPAISAVEGWTGRAALAWEPAEGWRLRAAVGRALRAPTMRELFGQALNRFLLNPDLKPERVISGEVAAQWTTDQGEAFLVGFAQDLDDTIDQRNVGRLRQRINLEGSTVKGVEAGGTWRPAPGWTLGGSATVSHVRRKGVAAGVLNRLAEKPAVLSRLYGKYDAPGGFGALLEWHHVGRAYSADANGALQPLPRSVTLNMRVSQRVLVARTSIELFVHADNLADTLVVPQLGLPAPGQSGRVGISVSAL